MARVEDVAAYILTKRGSMSAMKLQKLCYYAQAWHLVWDDRPLFDNRIEAWANGPVIPDLYKLHRGRFQLSAGEIAGDPSRLDDSEVETIEAVLEFYGDRSAHWLSELTHREAPWADTRAAAGLGPMQRGDVEIDHAAMAEYYDGLTSAEA
jgi:uncharacterized phage-associated protein